MSVKSEPAPKTPPSKGAPVAFPQVDCPKCEGTGKVELSDELRSVLTFVRDKKGCTAPDAAEVLDPTSALHPTAFNNRLDQLLELGLVTRKRHGKCYFYEPKT